MRRLMLLVITLALLLAVQPPGLADGKKEPPPGTVERLEQIFERRARWLITGEQPPPLEADYLPGYRTAKWALIHEKAKIESVRQWAETRGIRIVEARPFLKIHFLNATEEKARFYVAQSLALGYTYEGEETINRFGVGSRHIVELRANDEGWFIGLEWYADPLGEEGETPAFLSDCASSASLADRDPPVGPVAWRGYDRQKAVEYADQYCGLAAGCGNQNRYNTRFRDFSGEGGNCANFASQALRAGGISIPLIIRADNLIYSLTGSGRGGVAYKGKFSPKWKEALKSGGRFPELVQKGDLVGYHYKGKMAHVAIVTGFDSRGYPLVNSHTADRYHVPFDLGWDKSTTFWLVRVW